MATYLALIGNLVASREMPPTRRAALQVRLEAHFAGIPATAGGGIAAQPVLTLGDEFQALLTADRPGSDATLDLLTAILELARPDEVRFGLGVGALSTGLKPQALGMDGPCFHRARAAIERTRSLDLLCQLETGDGANDRVWSMLAAYTLRQRTDWTDAQCEAIALYGELGAWNKVAERLGVSPAAVSLRQKAAGWSTYQLAWDALTAGLRERVEAGRAVHTTPPAVTATTPPAS
jgi:hypothetical protein